VRRPDSVVDDVYLDASSLLRKQQRDQLFAQLILLKDIDL